MSKVLTTHLLEAFFRESAITVRPWLTTESMPGFLEVFGYYDPHLKRLNIDVCQVPILGRISAEPVQSRLSSNSSRQ